MLRVKLGILVALASLFAQVQCAAECATRLCGADSAPTSSVPPCHRHHGHSHDQIPDSCPHQAIRLAVSTQMQHVEISLVSVPGLPATASTVLPASLWHRELVFSAFSPPGVRVLFSTVRRI